MSDVGTIRRSPSIPSLRAKDLAWLIGEYLDHLRVTRGDDSSIDSYAAKLRWFIAWWQDAGPPKDWLLRPADLIEFERHLRQVVSARTKRRLSWHTRNDVLRRLREMFHWAAAGSFTDRDYAEWVPKADGGPPKRRAVGIADLIKLLAGAGASAHAARDRAMVAMMLGMGLRRVEVVNLNVEDVTIEADHSGYARVTGKRTAANGSGQRDAAFDAATGRILAAYLDECGYSRGPLFRNPAGARLSGQGVYRATKAMVAAAGLGDAMQACHDLRRAFATYTARQRRGVDGADRLRRQLGHANFSQTSEYVLLDIEDLRVDFISPLGAMPPGVLGVDGV